MKYKDLLISLDTEGYDIPLQSSESSIDEIIRKRRCPQCGGKMMYVYSMKKDKASYRGFLVCQKCSEVVEIPVTDI